MDTIDCNIRMVDHVSAPATEGAESLAGAAIERHIAAQAKESAAELLRQGWTAFGGTYDIGTYYGDTEALCSRLGRMPTHNEQRALEGAIRMRLDEGRPVVASRPL